MLERVPVLSMSFRPFFLLAALIAVINPTLWISAYFGHIVLPVIHSDALFWHGHEMLFGFTSALIAGFIFTASAHWTNSNPYQGWALLFLVFVWFIERYAFFLGSNLLLSLLLMNLFLPLVVIMLWLKVRHHPNQKYIFIPILMTLLIAKILYSYGGIFAESHLRTIGKDIGVGVIRFLILLIAGRVIPFFTKSKIEGVQIHVPRWINVLCLAFTLALIVPGEFFNEALLPVVLVVACFFSVVRQLCWKPLASIKVPVLFVLHLGVFLINLEMLLESLSYIYGRVSFSQAPLHLMLAGGLGVTSIGMMSRVSLGHTGRRIHASPLTIVAYLCVFIGTTLRVVIPILSPEHYMKSLHTSSGFWTLGFLLFFVEYSGFLVFRRPDSKVM